MKPTRLTIILLTSGLLFLFNTDNNIRFYPKKISPFIKSHLMRMKKIQSKDNFSLTRAFIIGDKRSLTKKQKKDYRRLSINHLFTPSGIHFSSFFIIFLPLIKRIRKKGYKITSYLLELSLCLLPFGLNQFYSLKRISLLRISGLTLRPFKVSIDYFYLFLISFMFDFFFGTFNHSPLSFSFSFLFLGTLLSSTKTSSLLASFLVANLFVSFFFYQSINLVGFILGFFITALFSLLFPIIFLLYWPSSVISFDLSSVFVSVLSFCVEVSSIISHYSPSVEIGIVGLLFIFLFTLDRKLIFLCLALLSSSCRVYNVPSNRLRSAVFDSNQILHNGEIKNGKQIFRTRNNICRRRIVLNGHQIKCREKKLKK